MLCQLSGSPPGYAAAATCTSQMELNQEAAVAEVGAPVCIRVPDKPKAARGAATPQLRTTALRE